MKWLYIVLAVLVVIAVGIVLINDEPNGQNDIGNEGGAGNGAGNGGIGNGETGNGAETHTVLISESGFSPLALTIKRGDKVEFVNQKNSASWPASSVHPTHRVYPGSSIEKCGTSEEEIIFDSCEGLQQGEQYSFTFNEAGTWNYHDHLEPGMTGSIIVNP